jgi:thymidylate synthase
MALPPCHTLAQFHVTNDNELSCSLYQRSGDVGLGIPFNIASYSFLTHILAHHCGLRAKEFIHFIGNAHIYEDHEIALNIQSGRPTKPNPKLRICAKHTDISKYSIDDFKIIDYDPYSAIEMKMRP